MKTREIPYNFSLRSRPACHNAELLRNMPAPNPNGLPATNFKCQFNNNTLLLIVLLTNSWWFKYRTNQCVLVIFDSNVHLVVFLQCSSNVLASHMRTNVIGCFAVWPLFFKHIWCALCTCVDKCLYVRGNGVLALD